jgi:hypothetical protein
MTIEALELFGRHLGCGAVFLVREDAELFLRCGRCAAKTGDKGFLVKPIESIRLMAEKARMGATR